MSDIELAELPPIKLGQLMAMSLDKSCHLGQISKEEQSILGQIGVPAIQYQAERLVLAGFAYDFAIVRLLGSSAVGSAVRAGFLEVWEALKKQGPSGQPVYDLFVSRCQRYGPAAARMFAEPGSLINPVAAEFSDAVNPSQSHAALALMLGELGVELFFAHLESAKTIFVKARLIGETDS